MVMHIDFVALQTTSYCNHMWLCRYGSHWKVSEAEKNLLRTHTTAVSSRMLYRCSAHSRHLGPCP